MLIRTCYLFAILIFAAVDAGAVISNIAINRTLYSRETGIQDTVNFSLITIFGATSGDEDAGDCATKTNTSTCNNCNGEVKTIPCTANRIHDNLLLQVTFQSDRRGRVRAYGGPRTRGQALSPQYERLVIDTPGGDTPQGVEGQTNQYTFTVPWSELCAKIGDNTSDSEDSARQSPNCSDVDLLTGELFFGIDGAPSTATGTAAIGNGDLNLPIEGDDDVNTRPLIIDIRGVAAEFGELQNYCTSDREVTTGACNFSVYPGDGKAYLDNVRTFQTSFNTDNYSAVRVFFDDSEDVSQASPFKDFNLVLNGAVQDGVIPLPENEIDGLINRRTYFFRIASVDAATNVGALTPPVASSECFDTTDVDAVCHIATPDEVVGLLEKEFDCFIATATYGSPMESHVATFRQFRNQILHATKAGRSLIGWYYKHSPPLARWIDRHPQWKPMARGLLTPLWLFASFALDFPILLMSLCLVILTVLLWPRRLRQ